MDEGPFRLYCRLGMQVLRNPSGMGEAIRLLAAAGVGVYTGGASSADGGDSRHELIRIHRYKDAGEFIPGPVNLSTGKGRTLWIRGLEDEYGGPGAAWLTGMREAHPGWLLGLWPDGLSELSVAVVVEGLLEGADAAICAGPGITGGAPLELVAAALALYGMPLVDAPAVIAALRTLREGAGLPTHPHCPVLGERIFHVGTGIHVDGLLKDTRNYEPWDPVWLGQRRVFVQGIQSGRAALKIKQSGTHLFD